MFIEIVDLNQQHVWVNETQVSLVLVPSPLSPGDGKCRMFAGPVGVELSLGEARRLLAILNPSLQ